MVLEGHALGKNTSDFLSPRHHPKIDVVQAMQGQLFGSAILHYRGAEVARWVAVNRANLTPRSPQMF